MCHLKNVSIVTFVTKISLVNKVSIYFLVTMSTLTSGCTNIPTVTRISCMSRLPKLMAYNYADLSEAFLSVDIFVF
jgi:hypothetical protein